MATQTTTHTLYENHTDGPIELVFYPNSHTYKIDGDKKIGVTTITGILDKPALMFWTVGEAAKFLSKSIDDEVLSLPKDEAKQRIEELIEESKKAYTKTQERGRDVGNEAHEWAEKFFLFLRDGGEEPALPEKVKVPHRGKAKDKLTIAEADERERAEQDNNIIAALEQMKTWAYDKQIEVIAVEKLLYSRKYDYCGTVDLIFRMDGKLYIADVKTTNPSWEYPQGVYPEMFAQIGGYDVAYTEEFPDEQIDGHAVLSVSKKTGKFNTVYSFDTEINRKWFIHLAAAKRGMQHHVRNLSMKYKENRAKLRKGGNK